MNRRLSYYLAALFLVAAAASDLSAQLTLPTRRCPPDKVPTKTEEGITFTGTAARSYVEAFLSGDPAGDSRVATNTTGLNASMVAILTDAIEADRSACSALNSFISNGESVYPSQPWVYFRAGSFFFATRWTAPPVAGGRFQTGHGTIMVFDSSYNLLGVWTA